MEKSVKKITHLSCLALLLFTGNKIIGKNGTVNTTLPQYQTIDQKGTGKKTIAFFDMGLPILKASKKLQGLISESEQGPQQTKEQMIKNRLIRNEITSILIHYFNEAKIAVLNENNIIGISDTKGWIKNKDTTKEGKNVQSKLARLAKLNTVKTTSRSFSQAYPIQEAFRELDELTEQQKKGKGINPHTHHEIKTILESYLNESKIPIFDKDNNRIGICNTKGWRNNETIREKVEAVEQKLNLLEKYNTSPIQDALHALDELRKQKERGKEIDTIAHDKIKNILMSYMSESKISIFDKNHKPVGTFNTKGWIDDKATRKKVEDVKRQLTLLTKKRSIHKS